MSGVKTVKLGSKTVTVRELTVAEIHSLATGGAENPVDTIIQLLTTCSSAKPEDIPPLTPSEIDPLIEAMLEVNSRFFGQMQAIGMEEGAESLRRLIKSVSVLPFMA